MQDAEETTEAAYSLASKCGRVSVKIKRRDEYRRGESVPAVCVCGILPPTFTKISSGDA